MNETDLDVFRQSCGEIINFLPMSIMVVDQNAIVTYVNKSFEKAFGKGMIKTLKRGPGDMMSCENSILVEEGCGHSAKCNTCLLRKYLAEVIRTNREVASIEIPLSVLGDYETEQRWFEVHAMPIPGKGNGQFLVSLTDISIYKKNSYQLLQNKKMADSANRAKSEFLANMSHEIRTPLNGVIGMIELTLLTKLDEEQKENLEVAKNCADTLLALINDVLDLSKVESNKVTLEEAQFDIRELIQKVADTQSAKLLEKDLKLVCSVDENMPPYFYADAFRIQQVLNNLLSNAVKFTEHGNIQLEVRKLCRSEDICTITFSVEDTGIGISQKEMTRLFKPFSQVDGSISRKYGGTGLGLAISQSLVQLMGGEIKVKSQKDKGSVFFFTIQVRVTEAPPKDMKQEVFVEGMSNPAPILVVEDDRANQMVIRQMLAKLGYHDVDTASNGFDGIKRLEKKEYDVVLMDIQLPEMDGIDTTHIIREKEKKTKKHVPIIALTAHALKGDKEKFLEEGMDGYVAKPVDPKLLKEALSSVLEKNNEKYEKEENLKEAYASWNYRKQKEGEQKPISGSDRRLFKTILNEAEKFTGSKVKTAESYIQIEKKIHELKIKAQRQEYESIKSAAFRLELAARKKDDANMHKLLSQLKELVEN